MSRHLTWRCACSREVGAILRRGTSSVLRLARSVDEIFVSPGSVAAICPTCGLAVYFAPLEVGFCTTMTAAAAS
jgi:hypothetical protein